VKYSVKNGDSADLGLIVAGFDANLAMGEVFSVQFSVGTKLAGAPGSLLPARVCHRRTSRQWGSQVLTNWSMLTGWIGMSPNLEKSFAHLCTRLHLPGHFLHMPEHPQTCLYMPEHACMAVESPSPNRKRGSEHLPSLALRLSLRPLPRPSPRSGVRLVHEDGSIGRDALCPPIGPPSRRQRRRDGGPIVTVSDGRMSEPGVNARA
jgi:hypothetical protein